MENRERQKKPNWLSWAFLILLLAPEAVIPVLVIAAIVYVIAQSKKNGKQDVSQKTTYTRAPETLDDCSKPLFCAHQDKSEHHVQRGREIDPWDRPDIDISKYQRKR